MGDVPGVVFPCGMIYRPESDELRLYYGAADSCVALATASLSEVLALSWNMAKRTRPIFRSEAATLPGPSYNSASLTRAHRLQLVRSSSKRSSCGARTCHACTRGGVAELIHRFPVTRFRWCPLVR